MTAPFSRRGLLAAGAAFAILPARAAVARTLITGGPIYTGVGATRVEALLVEGARIAFAGPLDEARRRAENAALIDLRGAAAFPGFVDSHVHLTGVGMRELTLNLAPATSLADAMARLGAWAQANPGGIISGRGWIETHWPERRTPTRADLDAVVPDRPVYLQRADGHAGVANSRALAAAGITDSTPDPAGGRIERDAGGAATGLLVDNAEQLIAPILPTPDDARVREALRRADALYTARGWTGAHNMSVDRQSLRLLEALTAQGAARLRTDHYMDVGEAEDVLAKGPRGEAGDRLRLRGVKVYADGALGSRGAALLAPYSDAPALRGLFVTQRAQALEVYARAKASGAQVATHAIGDAGNRAVLDWFAESLGPGRSHARWRIEHAQVIAPDDIARFAAQGVIASMQPSHAIGDLPFAPARLGPERLQGAYAWRSLIESGATVCGGSDAPVEVGDPRIEFYAACHRHALDGTAGSDWGLDQALSRAQTLVLFTRAAAYAVGREAEVGTLEPGKRADISAFSADFMTCAPADILKAQTVLTMINGQALHRL